MVSIIENWSDISGKILAQSSTLDNFITVTVNVGKVTDVPGFANLLENTEGKDLNILIPTELTSQLKLTLGAHINCRVRRGGPNQIFAHPDYVEVTESND